MKNQVLSIEQMRKLKELGVDTSKASMHFLYMPTAKSIMSGVYEVDDEPEVFVSQNGMNHEHPTFTLQDIIELLPKSISHKYEVLSKTYEDTYVLVWDMEGGVVKYCDDIGCEREYTNHAIIHVNEIGVLESFYNMLIFVAENGYLKTK